ncbi:MAG: hypothetical protein J3T61_01410 [Candidatus Brocadiales bacterium]|nr:hypothetical protein [Candidatus Bathyanammoxibius sp.]
MKVNKMWAMFSRDHVMVSWSANPTRCEVMDKVEQSYGMKWRDLYNKHGYRIEKVVVLRAEEFEELLAKQGGGKNE